MTLWGLLAAALIWYCILQGAVDISRGMWYPYIVIGGLFAFGYGGLQTKYHQENGIAIMAAGIIAIVLPLIVGGIKGRRE